MKRNMLRMISFPLAILMLLTSIPAEAVLAAESTVEVEESDELYTLEETTEAIPENEEVTEIISEEVSETDTEEIEEIFLEETSETDIEENSEEVSDATDEFDFVSNDGIIDFEVPSVDWKNGQNTATYMPYYLNEEVLGVSASDASYDARTSGCITSVKNQQDIGACWSFATIGALEASILKQQYEGVSADTLDLSEYQLAYFHYKYGDNYVPDPLGLTKGDYTTQVKYALTSLADSINYGGDSRMAAMTLMSWKGVVDEDLATYPSAKSKVYQLDKKLTYENAEYHAKEFYMANMTDRDSVKQLILDCGAVAASYYSTTGGLYYNHGAYFRSTDASGSNHAVLIVGWDDNYSADNFSGINGNKPAGNGAWLVKNSWGTTPSYLDQGYFYLSYYEGSINKAGQSAVGYLPEQADRYDNNYQYDGNSVLLGLDLGDKYATVYTATSDDEEYIEAVSFAVNSANVNYTVKVYANLPEDFVDPTEGTVEFTHSGTTTYAGYYTVDIPKEDRIALTQGEKFVVEVIFDDNKVDMLSTINYTSPNYGYVNATTPGTNFVGYSNGTWKDATDLTVKFSDGTPIENIEFRIKAYTTVEKPVVDDLPLSFTSTRATSFNNPTSNDLSWDAVEGAANYIVYSSVYENAGYTKLTTIAESGLTTYTYLDTLDIGSEARFYYVAAVDSTGKKVAVSEKKQSESGKLVIQIDPSDVNAVIEPSLEEDGSVCIAIPQGIAGATSYTIERKTDKGEYITVKTGAAGETSYTNALGTGDTDVQSGYYYTYRMQFSADAGYSEYLYSKTILSTKPTIESVEVTGSDSFTVTWKTDGRSLYNLYMVDGNGAYYNGGQDSTTISSRKFSDVEPQTEYKLSLSATKFASGVASIRNRSEAVIVMILSAPMNLEGSVVESGNQLIWDAVSDAEKYEIYRSDTSNGTYVKIGDSDLTEFTDSSADIVGKDYYYQVKAIGDGYSSSYLQSSATVHCVLLPSAIDSEDVTVSKNSVQVLADSEYISYAIRQKDATTAMNWCNKKADAAYVTFNNLTANTKYTIYAKAKNALDSTAVTLDVKTVENQYEVKTMPVAGSITYGQPLSASLLSGAEFVDKEDNSIAIEGTLRWVDDTLVLTAGTKEAQWVFVPTDPTYLEYTGKASIDVHVAKPVFSRNKRYVLNSENEMELVYSLKVENPNKSGHNPEDLGISADVNGNVSQLAVSNGTAELHIRVADLSYSEENTIVFSVTSDCYEASSYTDTVDLSSIQVSLDRKNLNLGRGESASLTCLTTLKDAQVVWEARRKDDLSQVCPVTYSADKNFVTVWDSEDVSVRKAILKYDRNLGRLTAIGDSMTKEVKLTISLAGASASTEVAIYVPVERMEVRCDGSRAENGVTLPRGQEKELHVTTYPTNANDAILSYASSDESVATVTGNTIKAHNPGNAILTISSKNGVTVKLPVNVPKYSCTQIEMYGVDAGKQNPIQLNLTDHTAESLYVQATLEDAEENSEVTEDANSFNFIIGDGNVANVSADGIVTAAGVGETTIYAYPKDSSDDYVAVSVIVTGTEPEGVETSIPAGVRIKAENSKIFLDCGNPSSTGAIRVVLNDGSYVSVNNLKFSSADPSVVVVDGNGIVRMNPSYLATGRDKTIVVTAALRGDRANRKVAVKVTVSGKPLVKALALQFGETSQTISGISREFSKGEILHLKVVPIDGKGTEITDSSKLKWSLSDTSVASVKVTGATTADVTMKKAGSCAVTVISQDAGKYTGTWNMHLVDTGVQANAKTLTVNKLKTTNTTQSFGILTNYGMEVMENAENCGITVDSVTKGKTVADASKFSVQQEKDGYVLAVDEDTLNTLGTGTYDVKLSVHTNDVTCDETTGEITLVETQAVRECMVKLSVVSKAPSIKIGTVKMNRFYKSEQCKDAQITSVDGAIVDVAISDATDGFGDYFNYEKAVSENTWKVLLDLTPENASEYTFKSMSGMVEITVDGYKPITKKVTIQTPFTKPTLTVVKKPELQKENGVVAGCSFTVENKWMPGETTMYEIVDYTNSSKLELSVPEEEPDNRLSVTVSGDSYRNGETIKSAVTLQSDLWNGRATLPLQVKVYTKTQPEIVMKKTLVTISNKASDSISRLLITVNRDNAEVNNMSEWVALSYNKANYCYETVWTEPYDSDDVANRTDFEQGICIEDKFCLYYNDSNHVIGVALASSDIPAGTYKYMIHNVINGYDSAYKVITIKVTDAQATANVSVNGSINLLNRDTPVTCKVAVKNSSAAIQKLEIKDNNYEITECEDHTFRLAAKKNVTLATGKQEVELVLTLEGSTTISTTVNFTNKMVYPMFKAPAVQTLRKSEKGDVVRYNLTSGLPDGYEVSKFDIVSMPKGIGCEVFRDNVVMSVSNPTLKPGTYKCKVNMYFEGCESTEEYPLGKAITKEITVRVVE